MLRRPSTLAAAGLLAFAAGACATDDGDNGPGANTSLDVVAAFYPLQFLAERVGGGHVAVTGLAPPGVEAHDLELTPSQIGELTAADLVIYLTDFQPAVDAAIDVHATDRAFEVTTVVPPLDEDHEDDDEDHDEDEDDHGDEDDGHGHGDADPHLWLDPTQMVTIADELAARFADLDADHANAYLANAGALRTELETLDTDYLAGLADCERREIVVSHAAFGHLAQRYDLRQIAITGLTPEGEPSPQRLQAVIDEAQAVDATTIFFEVLVSPDVAELIAREVGAETAVLDPIEGLAPGSDEDYLSLMRQNLDTLRTALDCT